MRKVLAISVRQRNAAYLTNLNALVDDLQSHESSESREEEWQMFHISTGQLTGEAERKSGDFIKTGTKRKEMVHIFHININVLQVIWIKIFVWQR